MTKATPIITIKRVHEDGHIVQMRAYLVPEPLLGSTHRIKYSLYYGAPGVRILAYDNERGKGDHVHRYDVEEPYTFTTLDKLVKDFIAEVTKLRGGSAL